MQCSVLSASINGVEAVPVKVEVAVSPGIPGIAIVGMPDLAVQEARERVRTALKNCGFSMPADKIVINLAPSSLRKSGSGFDLPIAAGILVATGQIPPESVQGRLLVGELSLEGRVRPVAGMLAYEVCAKQIGVELLCSSSCQDLINLDGLTVKSLKSLTDLKTFNWQECSTGLHRPISTQGDFSEIFGHEFEKRAFQIAAAGSLGLIMMGPPGSGKSMLASRIPSIMPALSKDERLETALIYSVCGEEISQVLMGERPFRAPHHTTTLAGLIGGGRLARPGEASLAHNGILFLDELGEFSSSVLQSIREPLETGSIRLVRANHRFTFPARFSLIAASNPCPCGYFGDPEIPCRCTASQVNNYQNRIGGPLMDRIDIHLDVMRQRVPDLLRKQASTTDSTTLKQGVLVAREFSRWRCDTKSENGQCKNNELSLDRLLAACQLDNVSILLLEDMSKRLNLSARGITRTLRIARVIADMGEHLKVSEDDLAEAFSYRVRESIATPVN